MLDGGDGSGYAIHIGKLKIYNDGGMNMDRIQLLLVVGAFT